MSHGSSHGVSEETMKFCFEIGSYIHNWELGHLELNSNLKFCLVFLMTHNCLTQGLNS